MGLEHPLLLAVLAAAWTAALVAFGGVQRRAVDWIEARSAPRFRSRLTRYSSANLRRHLVLLWTMGLLLALAAAGPYRTGEGRVVDVRGRLVLLLDASISMGATDVADSPLPEDGGGGGEGLSRFARAQQIALSLVGTLDDHRFALATFSGVTTFQLPMTADRALVEEAVSVAELHSFHRSSGSNFTAALDAALHFAAEGAAEGGPGLQVVLLSDGEVPRRDDGARGAGHEYGDALAALEATGVPLHAVALGSEEGQGRVLYDLRDPADQRGELATFHTRREEDHLRRMARGTGGWFGVDEPGVETRLVEEIRQRLREGRTGGGTTADGAAREDLAGVLLALFLGIFLLEAAGFDRRGDSEPAFDLDRLGPAGAGPRGSSPADRRARGPGPPLESSGVPGSRPMPRTAPRRRPGGQRGGLVLVLLLLVPGLLSCGETPLDRAHRENEKAIVLDKLGRHDAARDHYRRAIGFEVRPEVPTHNLARSRSLAGDWSEAHDLYQQALDLDPALVPALYNDGVALWKWGEAERDPKGCQLERTLELWQAARRRFAAAEERDGPLRARATANGRHADQALSRIRQLIADPPPECFEPSAAGGTGDPEGEEDDSGGEGGEGGGGPSSAGGGAQDNGSGDGSGAGGGADAPEDGPQQAAGGEGQSDEASAGAEDGDHGDPAGSQQEPGGGGGEDGPDGESRTGGEGRTGGESPEDGDPGPRVPRPLSAEEREEVRQALERLGGQRREEGKFFRRSRAEQFPREYWLDPDDEIWW